MIQPMCPENPAIRAAPERFGKILTLNQVETLFLYFSEWLEILGYTQEIAANSFIQDYFGAWCPYKDEFIASVFQRVALENTKKYDKMCAIYAAVYDPLVNYDRHEEETTTRTPNLTTNSSGSTSGSESRATTKNQIEHRADKAIAKDENTPWSESTLHRTAPYDSETLRDTDEDIRSEIGHRELETSYTGDPDTDSTTRSGTDMRSTTETGTDTHERDLSVVGNIGTMSSQNMANQELDLAGRMNIFREIERDLAAKLFIQVW